MKIKLPVKLDSPFYIVDADNNFICDVVSDYGEEMVKRLNAPLNAKEIVRKIEEDLTDRKGLRQEFESCDDDIQDEIRETWLGIVSTEINGEGEPRPLKVEFYEGHKCKQCTPADFYGDCRECGFPVKE